MACVLLPQVLVEAVTRDGELISLQMQNAETVKLMGPAVGESPGTCGGGGSDSGLVEEQPLQAAAAGAAAAAGGWRALSVAKLAVGDEVFALVQAGARHTGIAIKEFVVEK